MIELGLGIEEDLPPLEGDIDMFFIDRLNIEILMFMGL